jgi:hypothetical protein
MMKNKNKSREMQELRSQSHQKRKMNERLKYMPIFSRVPSTMKAIVGKAMITNRNLILLTRISRRVVLPRRHFTNCYQNIFLGYCFSCNNFGHKAIYCGAYEGSDHVRDINRGSYKTSNDDYVSNKNRISHGFSNINYNSFSPILDCNNECFKCNKYGHIACYCRSNIVGPPKQNREEDVLSKNK